MSEPGVVIAGAGHSKSIDDIRRIVSKYGGVEIDWIKKSSSNWNPRRGSVKYETHWYENLKTGKRYDFKTKEVFVKK